MKFKECLSEENEKEKIRFTTAEELKKAIDNGKKVHWKNDGYVVHKDKNGEYLETFTQNNSTVGVFNKEGKLNNKLDDYYSY